MARKVIEAHKPFHRNKVETFGGCKKLAQTFLHRNAQQSRNCFEFWKTRQYFTAVADHVQTEV
jgi:hypothetical protein